MLSLLALLLQAGPVINSDEDVFDFYTELVTDESAVLEGFSYFHGKHLEAFSRASRFLENGEVEGCDKFEAAQHYFFYSYTEKFLYVRVEPQFVFDPGSVDKVVRDGDELRLYGVPIQRAARSDGCYVTLRAPRSSAEFSVMSPEVYMHRLYD